jgi:hypothetical protein
MRKGKNEKEFLPFFSCQGQIDAKQLTMFLRHFFSVNFFAVSQRDDFANLEKEHKEYILQNQWPPKSYFDSVKNYEKEHAAWLKRHGKKETSRFFSFFSSSKAATAKVE